MIYHDDSCLIYSYEFSTRFLLPSLTYSLDDSAIRINNPHFKNQCASKFNLSADMEESSSHTIFMIGPSYNQPSDWATAFLPYASKCSGAKCQKLTKYRCKKCDSTFYCSRLCQRKVSFNELLSTIFLSFSFLLP